MNRLLFAAFNFAIPYTATDSWRFIFTRDLFFIWFYMQMRVIDIFVALYIPETIILANIVKTRAPRGTDRSPEYNEHFCYKLNSRVKNLTTEWNQKQQHFITHASRSLLWIRFVAVAFRSEEEVFWRRTPPTYFASPWIRSWANKAKTSLCMCRVMSTSSLPSFVNIH